MVGGVKLGLDIETIIAAKMAGAGTDGGYYTPSVDENGILSFTSSKDGMPEVESANVKGPQGATGATGADGAAGEKGDPGDAGQAGAPGYSPVRGTDYWTDADKTEIVAEAAELASAKKYGVRRAVGASSPAWERLGDAVGLTANAAVGTGAVTNDFMSTVYPYCRMKPCNLAADGTINAYLGDVDFDWYGSNGDVMLEVPLFYSSRYLEVDNSDGLNYEYRWISAYKLNGMDSDPLFWEDATGTVIKQKAYLPIFMGSLSDDGTTLRSVAGASPSTGKTRAQQRTLCTTKGSGWSLDDVWSAFALEHLYLIMFADSNSQAVLGNGRTGMAYSDSHVVLYDAASTSQITMATTNAAAFIIGQTVALGTGLGGTAIFNGRTIESIVTSDVDGESIITISGDAFNVSAGNVLWSCWQKPGETIAMTSPNGTMVSDSKHAVRFLWIEDWFGNIWQRMDGDNINNRQHYLCHTRSSYADNVYDGDYKAIGYVSPSGNGYVKELGCDSDEPMVGIVGSVGAASNTFYCDYYYQADGARSPLRGGHLSDGAPAGAFSWTCATSAASTYWLFGGRPFFK